MVLRYFGILSTTPACRHYIINGSFVPFDGFHHRVVEFGFIACPDRRDRTLLGRHRLHLSLEAVDDAFEGGRILDAFPAGQATDGDSCYTRKKFFGFLVWSCNGQDSLVP